VKHFEADFHEAMQLQHRDVLDELKAGNLTEKAEEIIKRVATEIAEKYKR
jgi:F-type H+-transporting ATPase subunit alpha